MLWSHLQHFLQVYQSKLVTAHKEGDTTVSENISDNIKAGGLFDLLEKHANVLVFHGNLKTSVGFISEEGDASTFRRSTPQAKEGLL